MKKYLLIGGSIATEGAIEGILSVDKNADITVLCGEKRPLYSRPLISYVLEKKTADENLYFRGKDYYEKKGVKAVFAEATAIDPTKKTVLADGKAYPYDKLLVATGSKSFVPPIKGLDGVAKKHTFYTMDDMLGLRADLEKGGKVLIVGAGLIGMKCAEGVKEYTDDIVVADMAPRPLPAATTPEAGAIVQERLKDIVTFRLNAALDRFEGNKAVFASGEEIDFDILVLALGVRPQVGLLKEIGAEINRGVIVNEKMQTSLADIYAAGDLVESYEAVGGGKRLLQLFPSAYLGGKTAGKNMAGEENAFLTDIPMNATKLFGVRITSAGLFVGEKTEVVSGEDYRAVYTEDGVIKGFILIGDSTRAGILTDFIRRKRPILNAEITKLLSDRDLSLYPEEERRAALGGNYEI
ncbi:MAG: NAD(P)/FAD-dependent oxidoreductase [Clostridia bacterium]|nr:NAD(P)/FAD-dependent oxidoreductase [Clostridia bacterium]